MRDCSFQVAPRRGWSCGSQNVDNQLGTPLALASSGAARAPVSWHLVGAVLSIADWREVSGMRSMGALKRKRRHRGFRGRVPRSPTMISGVYRLQPSPRTGLRLGGRYEILGLIDRGGSSEVYLARDGIGTLPVIVKMLTEEAARDMQHRERFVSSARSTMAIDHAAIGRVYSVEVAPNVPPYLVMEALQGESLSEYLDREERMPESLTLVLAREVAAGLVAAHDAGIIHRDIKPGNLYLLGPRGAPEGIKIIDFGLSKDLRNVGSGPASINLVLGTAQYMAPEQVLADPVDARTDIYAFGAVLFRMLTGQLPFDLNSGADLFCHQISRRLRPLPGFWKMLTLESNK